MTSKPLWETGARVVAAVLLFLTFGPFCVQAQQPPAIVTQPASQVSAAGGAAYFSVGVVGDPPLFYQWRKEGLDVPYGGNTNSYFINAVASADAGNYSVCISNSFGAVTSSVATLVVISPPSILVHPSSRDTNVGATVVFSVAATGTLPLNYQWRKDGTNIPGATLNAITLTAAQISDSGVYSVYVSNAAGGANSSNAVLNIGIAPAIVAQPSSTSAVEGQRAGFSVVAAGAPLNYQWRRAGLPIPGATGSLLSLESVSAFDATSYDVIVSNFLGSTTSTTAVLEVGSPPVILVQPQDWTTQAGSDFAVVVTASGTDLSYHWYKDGADLAGPDSYSYLINNAQWTNSGGYTVVVTNSHGAVTSRVATIFIVAPPVISVQPQSRNVSAGATVSLSVVATGMQPMTYQWRKNGVDISGAVFSSYTLSGAQMADSGTYSVFLSNAAGTATSSGAIINVGGTNPSIVTQPVSPVYASEGGSATFNVVATGSPLYYQWRKNGTAMIGATNSSLSLNDLRNIDAGSYTVQITNYLSSVISSTAYLYVGTPPSITVQPQGRTAQVGSNFTMSVTAGGSYSLYYQWRKDGMPLTGAYGSSYSINNAQWTNSGDYTVVVTNSYGVVTSSVATVLVVAPPAITAQPQSRNVSVGTTVSLSVVATGMLPMAYQWRKNGADISGAIFSSYTLSSAQMSDSGTYSVFLSNAAGTATSSSAVINVGGTYPSIVTQPASPVYASVGGSACFSVVASGAPLYYQWRKNGTAIFGATDSSLTLNNISNTDAGTYSVQITNFLSSVISSSGYLYVGTPPSITAQPQGRTAQVGSNFTISVTASGSSTLYYQWRKDGGALPGSSYTYSIYNAQWTNSGDYTVVVTNSYGAVTSSIATVLIVAPPVISVQPQSRNVGVGTAVSLSVVATGMQPMTYQWRKNGVDISGAIFSSYTLSSAQMSDAGTYTVYLSNGAGNTISSGAVINVGGTYPSIVTQPVSPVYANVGGSASFSVVATGTPLYYQWRRNGTVIPGATNSSLSFSNFVSSNAATYSVTVSNYLASTTSSSAYLYVGTPPSITVQPQGRTAQAGAYFALSVTVAGSPTLYYQWRKDDLVLASGYSSSYSINNAQWTNSGDYTVVVTNQFGTMTSSVATVFIVAPPVITTQPAGRTATVGTTVSLSVAANGMLPMDYQWRKNGVDIPGATVSSYTLGNAQFADSGSYSVHLSNSAGSILSSNAVINVGIAPTITTQPQDAIARQGNSVLFSVTATGVPLNYQWRRNGQTIAGATDSVYTLTNAAFADGGSYSMVVSNFLGVQTSSNAVLTLLDSPPVIITQPQGGTNEAGTAFALDVLVIGADPLSFQWRRDGTNLVGETAQTFAVTNAQTGDSGAYDVVITNAYGTATSTVAAVSIVWYPPAITTQPVGATVEAGTNFTLSVTAAGTAPLFCQWRKDGAELSGATNFSWLISNARTNDSGNYDVVISNGGGAVTSSVATLAVVVYPPSILIAPTNQAVRLGSNATFTVTASGTSPLVYQWLKSGTNIENAVDRTYTLTNVDFNDAGTFAVMVANAAGSVTSAPVMLWVGTAPLITTQPQGGTVEAGTNFSFSVSVTGTAPLSYQWRKEGANVAGATTETFDLLNVSTNDAGGYDVVITSLYGAITSSIASLSVVLYPPAITAQPVGAVLPVGTNFTLTVTASGTAPLCYQWRKDGTNLAGATGSAWQLVNVRTNDSGAYDVVITNAASTVTSTSAVLVVGDPPVIIAHPQSTNNAPGDTVTFVASVSGTEPMLFQWFKDGNSIEGSTNAVLIISNAEPKDVGIYSLHAANALGSAVSSNATLNLTGVPFNLWQGLVAYYAFDGDANDASVFGNHGSVNGASFSTDRFGQTNRACWFDGATAYIDCKDRPWLDFGSSNFTISVWLKTASNQVGTCVLAKQAGGSSGGYGLGMSGDSYPSASIADGSTNVVATGFSSLNDGRWHQLTAVCNRSSTLRLFLDGILCAETNVASLTGPVVNPGSLLIGKSQSGQHFGGCIDEVRLYNRDLSQSDVQALFAAESPAPVIIAQPHDVTIETGMNATFSVIVTGAEPLGYQWRLGSSPISGATANSYTVVHAQSADAGSYTVVVTNLAGSVESAIATLTLTAPAQPLIDTGESLGFATNHFGFNITGSVGQTVIVDVSTNLAEWTPIQTNTLENTTLRFVDPRTTTNAVQFFRLRLW